MADDNGTVCKAGGYEIVFKGQVKPGSKLTVKDIKTINGAAPKEPLPVEVENFLSGIAGNEGAK